MEGKALHFQNMSKLLKPAIEVVHLLEVVEGLNPSEASLAGLWVLQGIAVVIPEDWLVGVLR